MKSPTDTELGLAVMFGKAELDREKLAAELAAIRAALRNYELNGSNAAKQIEGIYADLEIASREAREARADLAEARRLLADLVGEYGQHQHAKPEAVAARAFLARGGVE